MYNKEYVEPVSGQGLISSLFAGPATPINQVVPNEITLGRTMGDPSNIFPSGQDSSSADDILSQITAQSNKGVEDSSNMPSNPLIQGKLAPKAIPVSSPDVSTNTVAISPNQRFSAEELSTNMSAPDPKNFTQNISDAVNRVVPEGIIKTDPTKAPIKNIINTAGGAVDYLSDLLARGVGGAIKAGRQFVTDPGKELDAKQELTDDEVRRIVDAQSGNITDFDYGGTARDMLRNTANAVTPVAANIANLGREAYGTIEDMADDFRNRDIDYAGMPAQPASPTVDATDATNPVSPNMSTGPSMRLNEMTVKNPDAIPILPGQEPGGGRSGADSIIQSLGLLEMSEAQRAERIARLPEDTRDAVLQRVTDMMQSASVGDDIEL
jgi:hypothetical protein